MKRIIFTTVKVIFSVLLVIYIVNKVDIRQVWGSLKSVNLLWLGIAYLVHLMDYPISTLRWKLLLDAQGIKLPYKRLLGSYFVGTFFSTFLPTGIGGDMIRAYDTIRWGKTAVKPVMVIFVERLSGLFALMVIAASILLFSGLEIKETSFLIWVCALFFVLMALFLLIILWAPVAKFLSRIFNFPGLKFFRRWVKEMYEALHIYRHKAKYIGWVLMAAFLLQLVVVLHYFLIGFSLGIPVPFIYYFLIIPVISLLLMLPITISGIGVRESAYVFFFSAYGVLNASALALAWLSFGFVILTAVIGAVVYVLRR